MFDYDERESEYMTIIEMLNEMSLGKAVACILGFHVVIGIVGLLFAYWVTR